MIRAFLIGTLISLAYTQTLFKATKPANLINKNNDLITPEKPNKPTRINSNIKPAKDTKEDRFSDYKNIIEIPVIKDCDTDKTEEERQQKSVIDSENSDCAENHKKRRPGHIPVQTTNIVGTWSPLKDTKIRITFDGSGNLTLQGCNINSCSYTLNGRKFSRDGFCLGTQRFCQDDKDSLYLDLLKSSKFVVSGGKDKIVFLDEHFHRVLVIFRVLA